MKRYLLIGDGSSPHLVKWGKELVKHLDLYLFSFKAISEEMSLYIDRDKIFSLNRLINQKGGNFSVINSIYILNRFIQYVNPEIVNPHYITSNGFMAVLIKKLYRYPYKIISSCWGSDILVTPEKNFLYKKITRYILGNSDLITSDSFYMTDRIISLSPNARVLTFPFGVEKLPPKREKDPNLFFSNRMLKKNYNIDKIIIAFAEYLKINGDAKLIIANDGYLKDELIDLINMLKLNNNVKFVGFLSKDEQEDIYSRASFYISIPDSDSTSVSLLEAMSHGCIPIVSNIPANREWVNDGENGFFFTNSFKNINISTAILEKMMDRNRKIIEEKGIWEKNIKEFVRVIYEM
ncbi:MAG: glycosyltransferase family 4 protein [Calditerrivibrio sp.]|nr:glycosyltransferase family 4 protein [Calditerrivibrio sp.]MCA1932765.1 glycosyltransferase family 4 protein [Calditerrivibrio sp.]MCA1980907.1 glycosyltransferase family 4 protein [Calditerrivibrio sp.]